MDSLQVTSSSHLRQWGTAVPWFGFTAEAHVYDKLWGQKEPLTLLIAVDAPLRRNKEARKGDGMNASDFIVRSAALNVD